MNWRQWKSPNPQVRGTNGNQMSPPPTPKQAQLSPVFGTNQRSSSASDLKKATKLARLALDFSRKRGKAAHTDISKCAPFIFRNRSGMKVNCSGNRITATAVENACDAQLKMSPVNNEVDNVNSSGKFQHQNDRRLRKYDGEFPTIDIELDFGATLATTDTLSSETCRSVFADLITDLPTGRVEEHHRSVRVWKKNKDGLISQYLDLVWSVELEENRRVLTLSSATNVKVFGCGPAIEIGICLSNKYDQCNPGAIATIGTTEKNGKFNLPLWVESCFCQVDVFIRPFTPMVETEGESNVYSWSTFPVLSKLPDQCNAESTEVKFNWTTEIPDTLGGVSCPLSGQAERTEAFHPVWLECSYSKDMKNERKRDVSIWSAVTIRNMLP